MPVEDPIEFNSTLANIPVVSKVKILGIWFMREDTIQNRYLLNFKPQLQRIKAICDSWSLRSVSLKGKVTIVNSLLISLLHYPSSSTFTPPQVFGEYKKMISAFIWNGKKPKVSYDTLVLPVACGGLNLMDLQTRVQVSTLQWVRRLLLNPSSNAALSLPALLGTDNLKAFLSYKLKDEPPGISHDPFYQSLFKLWATLHGYYPENEEDIRRESIWGNKWITADARPIFNDNWESRGIRSIQDICHPTEPRLLSHIELSEAFGIRCSFLDILGLRLSVPLAWRQSLSANFVSQPDPTVRTGIFVSIPGDQPTDVANLAPRKLYSALILSKGHRSTAYKRWLDHSDPSLQIQGPEEWNHLCLNVYKATRETKLQALHFRILNRIVPCRAYLAQLRILDSDACQFCNNQDSLLHFFYECPLVKSFWMSIQQWFVRIEDLHLEALTSKDFLLGLPQHAHNARKINAILISTKFFIYRQRLFHQGQLDPLHWLREFRTKLLIEKEILIRQDKRRRFAVWNRILNALG